eukprot:NODE_109_length_18665_cov_0.924486.p8 type:complete len:323 gc:universal NODE_109_length_18665_cov_0.924486:6519-5551(-)
MTRGTLKSQTLKMRSEVKGFLFVTASALFFSWMSLFVKSCSLGAAQIVFIRSVCQTLIAAIACWLKGINPFGKRHIRALLLLRGLFGAFSVGFYFYGVRYGNLGDTTAVFFTAPAMTTILSAMFLKQSLNVVHLLSILFCLLGTLLVARPSFLGIFPVEETSDKLALLISLAGAFISACAYIMIAIIGNRANHLCLVFYFGITSSLISFFPTLFIGPIIPNILDSFYLIGVVIFAYLGQVTVNRGLQLASSSATLMRNLDVVFAFLYSFFLFDESINILSLVGALFICFGTALIFYEKYRSQVDDVEIPSSPTEESPILKED